MRIPRRLALLGSLALAFLLPAPGAAQPTPLTPVFAIHDAKDSAPSAPSVAAEPGGDFVVAWRAQEDGFKILFRRFDASGAPATGVAQANLTPITRFADRQEVAVHAATGNFLIVWVDEKQRLFGRTFDRAGTALTGEVEISGSPDPGASGGELSPSVAATPAGFVVSWRTSRLDEPGVFLVLARRLDPTGALLGPEIRVDEGVDRFIEDPAVAADAAGSFAVVWTERDPAFRGVRGRLFHPDGTPKGGEIQLAASSVLASSTAVAYGPDGGFLVAWATRGGVFVRALGSDSAPRGLSARLNVQPDVDHPDIAPDGHGGFAVFWSTSDPDFGSPNFLGRIVQGSGRPRGPEFSLASGWVVPAYPSVAAGPLGRLIAAWNDRGDSASVGVFGQRLAVPPATGADPCVIRDGRLVCATLRGEENAALEIPLPRLGPGYTLVFGDFNGDQRDDVCTSDAHYFLCYLDHDGGEFDAGIPFGILPGDVPLLGDLNGDGRDDACVRRGRRFSCDTARDGGSGEVQITLGLKTDLALMGDFDGDGDDDPCLYRRDRFLCDTAHNGGRAEVTVIFGLPGDVPLLGDVDADGDDDPCVFRGDRFLCDTAHDGGAAEIEIPFGEPGAIPLLANVDGF